jgi:hypothetical protein
MDMAGKRAGGQAGRRLGEATAVPFA